MGGRSEPYGRRYSHRRIADKTGHSETTVRNVINDACREVVKLKNEGLQVEQIASQLGYPLAFVSRILRKYEEKEGKQEEKIKAEIEAEVEPKVEVGVKPEIEEKVIEASKELDVKKRWENFQKDLEIGKRKAHLRSCAKNDLVFLRESVIEYKNKGVFDQTYDDRQKMFRLEIEDFVLKNIDEVDTIEAISDLEGIWEQIEENLVSMVEVYGIKADVGK